MSPCPQCHTPIAQDSPPFCPQCRFPLLLIAGKYRLLEEINAGGYGSVYKAVHVRLTEAPERAIKILNPQLFEHPSSHKRFEREVQVTALLSQENPHIVRIYDDFGELPHLGRYYVMEYLKGEPLDLLLQRKPGALPLGTCGHIFLQLCDAIEAAHSRGILHRDIKPANLFVIDQKQDTFFLKVIDFGISKPFGQQQQTGSLTQGALGTPAYMAPEQCMHKPLDERTDIYAMGVLLYELCTGQSPFDPPHKTATPQDLLQAHIVQPPPRFAAVCPRDRSLPAGLEDIVMKALAKRPKERFSQAREFAQALRELFEAEGIEPTPPEPRDTPSPSEGKKAAASQEGYGHTAPRKKLPSPISPATANAPIADSLEQPEGSSEQPPAPSSGSSTRTYTPDAEMTLREEPQELLLPGTAQGQWNSALTYKEAAPALDDASPPQTPSPPQTLPSEEPDPSRSGALLHGVYLALLCCALLAVLWMWRQKPKVAGVGRDTPQKRASALPARRPVQTAPRARQKAPPRRRQARPRPKGRQPASQTQPRTRPQARPRARLERAVARRPRRRGPPAYSRRVAGCPASALFWTRIHLPPAQRQKVRPRLKQGGRLLLRSWGFCVGVPSAKSSVQFGDTSEGFVPCTLTPGKLSPRVRIVLQQEGGLEPESVDYCVSGRAARR